MQATTPIDFRVLDKMMPYLTSEYGNPHSRTHEYGWITEKAVEESREEIAKLLQASPKEIFFQSGATESNNTAIIGLANFYGKTRKHIITTNTEHKTVLESCEYLQKNNDFKITILQVQANGLINLEELQQAIEPQKTLLVSVMALNNEIGVIQELERIGEICKKNKVFFHTDAAQAVGKFDIDVNKMNIDLLSLTGHKAYGPKGIGALYIRRKPRVRILPIIKGGGQERGIRSGTLPPALCIGLGETCRLARVEQENDLKHINKLFEYMVSRFNKEVEDIKINGCLNNRYKGNLNISFGNVPGQELIENLKQKFALSAGAACIDDASYVLKSLKLEEKYLLSTIRIGVGRFTTEEEVTCLVDSVVESVIALRKKSIIPPLQQAGEEEDSFEGYFEEQEANLNWG